MDLTDKGNVERLANGLHSVGIPVLRGNGSYPPPSVRDGNGGCTPASTRERTAPR
jgi:hypothetical protein